MTIANRKLGLPAAREGCIAARDANKVRKSHGSVAVLHES